MREVIFYLAMIIEIAYVFMSQVPKKLENKYLLIGTAFICASDFTYHIGYNAINMSVSALSGTIAISIFLISFVVGVITKRIDFEDLFFSLFMELFLPLLTMLLTKSYELIIFVIIAVVGLGMIKIFMAHKEKNNRQERGFLRKTKVEKMTVKEFLQNYGGNECVSIEGYCEEEHYDYFREADEWELSDDNPNHYKPTCIAKEPWWNEVKDREIKEWNIIGGGMYKVELWIDLEEE